MSVVIPPIDYYFGFHNWGVSGTKDLISNNTEHRFYEIRKAIKMLSDFNPNIVPLLWLDPQHYEVMTPQGKMLVDNRHLFNSKKAYHTFSGYAHGQLQKMGGVFNDAEEPNKLLKAGHEKFQRWVSSMIDFLRLVRDGKSPIPEDCTPDEIYVYDEGWLNSLIALRTYAKEECKRIKDGPITGRMGAKRKELRAQYGFDCYEDSTTEFLSDRGWLKWDDVSAADKLATINITTMNTEFQHYTERHEKLYTGPMFTFNGSNYRTVVTANHHMLVSPVHNRNQSREYDEQYAQWQLTPVSTLLNYEDSQGIKRTNFIIVGLPTSRQHCRRSHKHTTIGNCD
jgi:hypothetical protein